MPNDMSNDASNERFNDIIRWHHQMTQTAITTAMISRSIKEIVRYFFLEDL